MDGWKIKRASLAIQPDNSDEHQCRAGHGVQEEFHCSVNPPLVSPDSDEERHGNEHHFPEQEEEEKIQRNEHANDTDFQQQHHDEEFFDAMIDAVPRSQNRNRRQKRRQNHQEHADAVYAQVIVDGREVDPFHVFLERIARYAYRHLPKHEQGKNKFDERYRQRQPADPHMVVAAENHQRERAQGREENQEREQIAERSHQRTIPSTGFAAPGQKKITARIITAPTTTHTA